MGFIVRPSRSSQLGFTLVELMTVVIMITVFAAIAIPMTTQQMRERRAQEAAERVAGVYRGARLRAMGRGSAVLVRYTAAGRGRLEVREAQRGSTAETGCEALPISSCLSPDWNGPEGDGYRAVTTLDLTDREEYDRVNVDMLDMSNDSLSTLDICFTPMGRAFTRTNTAERFAALTDTHVAEVYRGDGAVRLGRTRRIIILPNGASRID